MSLSSPELLLFVFLTHMPFFAWRYHRTGERRHAATTITFAILSLAYGFRVFAPELSVAGVPCHGILRGIGLLSAVWSVSLLVHHLLGRRRTRYERG